MAAQRELRCRAIVWWVVLLAWCCTAARPVRASPPDDAATACEQAYVRGEPMLDVCERAIAQTPDAPLVQVTLALALLEQPERVQHGRVKQLITRARASAPRDLEVLARVAAAAAQINDAGLLDSVADDMLDIDEDDPRSQAWATFAALGRNRWLDAHRHLDELRELGIPPAALRELEQIVADATPWPLRVAIRVMPALTWLLLAWLLVLIFLIVTGTRLSRAAQQQAERVVAEPRAEGTPDERRLLRHYRRVLIVCGVFYYASLPFVLIAIVVLVGGIVLFQLALGFVFVKLTAIIGVLGLVSMVAVVRSVVVLGSDVDPGPKLDLAAHGRVRALLERVASEVGTRAVDVVFLTPGTAIGVFERGSTLARLRGDSQRCLLLGVGLIDALDRRELAAVLAHEYGHFQNADTSAGSFALGTRRSLHVMARRLAESGSASPLNPAWLFLSGYERIFLRISQGASRLQEVLADRWAAHTHGSEAFCSSMRKIVARSIAFAWQFEKVLEAVASTSSTPPNIYRAEMEPIPSALLDVRVRNELDSEPSVYDSHPRPADRIAWVERLACVVPHEPDEELPAWSLFEDREAIEREMTALVFAGLHE